MNPGLSVQAVDLILYIFNRSDVPVPGSHTAAAEDIKAWARAVLAEHVPKPPAPDATGPGEANTKPRRKR